MKYQNCTRTMIILLLAMAWRNDLAAQSPVVPTATPPLVAESGILNWTTFGVDSSTRARNSQNLLYALEQTFGLPAANPLLDKNSPAENQRKTQSIINPPSPRNFIWGQRPATKGLVQSIVQPIWCRLEQSELVFAILRDRQNGAITSIGLASSPRSINEKQDALALAKLLAEAHQDLLARIPATPNSYATPQLKLGISLARNTASQIDQRHHCALIAVGRQLMLSHNINLAIAKIGIPSAGGSNGQQLRANRYLQLDMQTLADRNQLKINGFQLTDGIFGNLILKQSEKVVLPWQQITQGRWKPPLPKVIAAISKEQQSLGSKDRPKIVYQYGRWSYLDRGRAYGLKLYDRLIASNGGKARGQIVRHFGADLKIKDPQGQVITDGAIMYVREGLAEVKLGESFDYDPKTYPHP
jgi:hypothetical protein